MPTLVADHFKRIKCRALSLVQPYLVAIYQEKSKLRCDIEQIGTGFLIAHQDCAVLVTAKHTLYGHDGSESAGDKAIFVDDGLQKIGHLKSHEVCKLENDDIAAMYVDEFSLKQCLPQASLCTHCATPKGVTIQGFLARNFNRQATTGVLRPTPYIYTNSRKEYDSGLVALKYPKNRNRSTNSGKRVMAPCPRGISGGPMLDADKLALDQISIIGVFTDYLQVRGMAYGESSIKALGLIRGMG